MNEVEVYCPCNKGKGCDWKGSMSNIKDHIKSTCDFQTVECPHCKKLFIRLELVTHLTVCPYRPETCQQCDISVPKIEMGTHIELKCPLTVVICDEFTFPPGIYLYF